MAREQRLCWEKPWQENSGSIVRNHGTGGRTVMQDANTVKVEEEPRWKSWPSADLISKASSKCLLSPYYRGIFLSYFVLCQQASRSSYTEQLLDGQKEHSSLISPHAQLQDSKYAGSMRTSSQHTSDEGFPSIQAFSPSFGCATVYIRMTSFMEWVEDGEEGSPSNTLKL